LLDYIRLLDLLGVDHTHLDREYCCGMPLLMESTGEELDHAQVLSLEFNRLNLDLARQKGASTLAYCCIGCVHAAKHAFKDAPNIHVYIVDLILDKLENHRLKMKATVMGYFEGCHTIYRALFPGTVLDWYRYRQRLDRVEGLKIVDLPKNLCCKKSAAEIVEKAAELNLDKIVCACNWCYSSLKEEAREKLHMASLPELLLQTLENH
jgi:heterodisulfide reductase subunit B